MFYGWSTSMYVRVEENDFLFAKKNNFFVMSSYFHDFSNCSKVYVKILKMHGKF